MGQNWTSGVDGGSSVIKHIIGAWQIYQHSGDKDFLHQAYEFYRGLYWDNPFNGGKGWGKGYDCAKTLSKMARVILFDFIM